MNNLQAYWMFMGFLFIFCQELLYTSFLFLLSLLQMQSMGIISNSLNGVGSSEAAGLSINNRTNLMSDYEFIHCFRRDSNKVQNYLKVLKCRIVSGNSCWIETCRGRAIFKTTIGHCLWGMSKIIYKGLYQTCRLSKLLTESLDSCSFACDLFYIVISWKKLKETNDGCVDLT